MTLKEFHAAACAAAADYGRMDATKIHVEVKYQIRSDNGEDEFTWKIYDHHGGLFISTLEPLKVPNPGAALANYRLRLEVWKQAGGDGQDMGEGVKKGARTIKFSEPGTCSTGPEIEWRYDPHGQTSKAMVGNSTLYVIPPDALEHPEQWKWIVRLGTNFMHDTTDTEGLCDTREEGYILAEDFFEKNRPEHTGRKIDVSLCKPAE